jgi:hypothetical protein
MALPRDGGRWRSLISAVFSLWPVLAIRQKVCVGVCVGVLRVGVLCVCVLCVCVFCVCVCGGGGGGL